MIPASHPCDGLFNDALEAFERVARGASPNCSNAVVDVLLGYGLIRRTVRVIGIDSLDPVVRHGYSLPSEFSQNGARKLKSIWLELPDDRFRRAGPPA